jgi:hypothetical protein
MALFSDLRQLFENTLRSSVDLMGDGWGVRSISANTIFCPRREFVCAFEGFEKSARTTLDLKHGPPFAQVMIEKVAYRQP